jgi:hypothetical protein
MLVDELEIIVYPNGCHSHSKVTKTPTWEQIESAVRQLDRHGHPFLRLILPRPKSERDVHSLEIIGGLGEYGVLTFNSVHHQLQWYCDPSRPDGQESVQVWTSDQGAAFEERYLCNDLATLLRIAKLFAEAGKLDPDVNWEDWPPAKLRRPG